jgi:hypothetical protein
MMSLAVLAPLFPYDPRLDSVMGHQHLLLGYAFTWGIQLAYVLYVAMKWRATRRAAALKPESEQSH